MTTFDPLARTYDTDFTYTAIGTHLRKRVHRRLLTVFSAGDHLLEIGCGTGEDALFLAQHGIKVTATDASAEMLKITAQKTTGFSGVTTHQLDLNTLPVKFINTNHFEGVLSNFGALNCTPDWERLAEWLAPQVKQGGTLGFAIMAPFCIWETLWHGLHFDFKTATRRWRDYSEFKPDSDQTMRIYYPTVKQITEAFRPHFERTRVQPLGLFLPPSDVYPVIEKRKRLLRLLTKLDDATANVSKLALFADHYWIEFTKT